MMRQITSLLIFTIVGATLWKLGGGTASGLASILVTVIDTCSDIALTMFHTVFG